MKLHQQRIATNGIELNVASAGEGSPVVLLHGFPDTHDCWRKQAPALVKAGYRVIMPDMRGYGESDAPEGAAAYGVDILCADIVGLLDTLKLKKVYLVGHDWGAVVGWHVCMVAPERVERFAALSVGHPNAYAKAGVAQKLKAWYAGLFQVPGVAEAMLGAGNLLALKHQAADDVQLAAWRANFARKGRLTAALNYYRANRQLMLASDYPPVTAPVLGVWSEGDPALTEDQMRNSSRYVAGAFRYERISGKTGHWLQLEEAERINQLLLEFGKG